jgi:SPP1 gp7 family putative phage head morphogenesis protein
MLTDDIFNFSFDFIPEEIINYLKDKGVQTTYNLNELWQSANNTSFTVAKVLQTDLLVQIQDSIVKAIESGQSIEQWKRQIRPELIQNGWWGKVKTSDIPGFDQNKYPNIDPNKVVQLGSNSRLKTVFYTNRTVAYSQARYKALIDNAKNRPFWQYIAVEDSRTRKYHLSLSGKVWRFDDPVWDTLFPPNDHGCRCTVRALSEAQLNAENLSLSSPPSQKELDESVKQEWAYNAGASNLGLAGAFWESYRNISNEVLQETALKMIVNSSQWKGMLREYASRALHPPIVNGKPYIDNNQFAVGFLSDAQIKKMESVGITPETGILSISAKEITHAIKPDIGKRFSLTVEEFLEELKVFQKESFLFDSENDRFIFVNRKTNTKFILGVNYRIKNKKYNQILTFYRKEMYDTSRKSVVVL